MMSKESAREVEKRPQSPEAFKASKKELRREIRNLRAAYRKEEIHALSMRILERVRGLWEYQRADTLFIYMDARHEVETSELIRQAWADGKRVAVPKVSGRNMRFFYIASLERDLKEGAFGILEPCAKDPADEATDSTGTLLVMPGVAFDESRHRIGYGGGFYDRFLKRHPDPATIALAFEFQVREEIPFEGFDMLPGKIVTEKRVIS